MAQSAPQFVEEGLERLEGARERIDDGLAKARKDLRTRRKRIEKQLAKNRRTLEREVDRTRRQVARQVQQLRKEIEKNGVVGQLSRWRNDAEDRLEGALESVLGTFQIATQSDVRKLDRKLSKLGKQLEALEKKRASAKASPTHEHASA